MTRERGRCEIKGDREEREEEKKRKCETDQKCIAVTPSRLVFMRFLVRIQAGTPAIITGGFRSFLLSVQKLCCDSISIRPR